MTHRCGDHICIYDSITYDDIKPPCISVGNDMCVSCETVKSTRIHDPEAFNDNPLAKLFALENASTQQTKQIWAQLGKQCGIKRPTMTKQKQKQKFVVEPDLNQVSRDMQKISSRLKPRKRHQIINWLLVLQRISTMAYHWNTMIKLGIHKREIDITAAMKRDILSIVQDVKCGGSHHPRELPIGVSIFLNEWAKSKSEKFQKIVKFLNTSGGCMEGKIQIATEMTVRD